MKKLLPLAAIFVVAACNSFSTDTYQDELMMPLADGAQDSLYLSIGIEYPVNGMDAAAIAAMTETIAAQAFDLEVPASSLEESAIRYREDLIDEYLSGNEGSEGMRSWEDRLSGYFNGDFKNWKNYLFTYYSFRGGAHGLQTLTNIVFDRKTGAQVHEADLFAPGYQEPVSKMLRAAVKASFSPEDSDLAELVNYDGIFPNDNFSVSPQGVQWTFQPYEAGPYALGIITATISWDELKPWLQ